jgi:hypothetical protein
MEVYQWQGRTLICALDVVNHWKTGNLISYVFCSAKLDTNRTTPDGEPSEQFLFSASGQKRMASTVSGPPPCPTGGEQ